MSEKIDRPTWLDDADVAQFAKAQLMDGQIVHLIWDKQNDCCGFISTFEDDEELAEMLRQTLERVESGKYRKTRKEIDLASK
jgi:hypothetical protein